MNLFQCPLLLRLEYGYLFNIIYNYLDDKKCEVYTAPFDVRLADNINEISDNGVKTVVQPDISVICDKDKLDEKGCKGAPDLIIEIASPSSLSLDYVKKLNIYAKYKVREYWIVDPADETLLIYKLDDNTDYSKPLSYGGLDEVQVGIFDSLTIKLQETFKD